MNLVRRVFRAFAAARQRISLDQLRTQQQQAPQKQPHPQPEEPAQMKSQPPQMQLHKLVKVTDVYRAYYAHASTPMDRSAAFCRLLQLVELNQTPKELESSRFRSIAEWVEQNITELSPESLVAVLEAISKLPSEQAESFSNIVADICLSFKEQGSMQLISYQLALRVLSVSYKLSQRFAQTQQFRKIVQLCLSRVLPYHAQIKTTTLLVILKVSNEMNLHDKSKIKLLCEELLRRKYNIGQCRKYLKSTNIANMFIVLYKCKELVDSFKESQKDIDLFLRCLKALNEKTTERASLEKLMEVLRLAQQDTTERFKQGRLEYWSDMLLEGCLNELRKSLESVASNKRCELNGLQQLLENLLAARYSTYIDALAEKTVKSLINSLAVLDLNSQVTLMWWTLTRGKALGERVDWSKMLVAGERNKINANTVRMMLSLIKHAKTAQVCSNNEAIAHYIKQNLKQLMKSSNGLNLQQLEQAAVALSEFCRNSPGYSAKVFKEVIRGLKTNAKLPMKLIDYLEENYLNLNQPSSSKWPAKEVEAVKSHLLSAIHTAYLGVLLLQKLGVSGNSDVAEVEADIARAFAYSMSSFGFDGIMGTQEAIIIASLEVYFLRVLIVNSKMVEQCDWYQHEDISKRLLHHLQAPEIEQRRAHITHMRIAEKAASTSEAA